MAIGNWPSQLAARLSILAFVGSGATLKVDCCSKDRGGTVMNRKAPRSQTNHLVMDAARGTAYTSWLLRASRSTFFNSLFLVVEKAV